MPSPWGEFLAGKRRDPTALEKAYPETPLVVSTVTSHRRHVAQGAPKREHVFFPSSLPHRAGALSPEAAQASRRSSFWKPKSGPILLRACHRRGIPVAICNGRLSEKSYSALQKIRLDFAPLFQEHPADLRRPIRRWRSARWGRRGGGDGQPSNRRPPSRSASGRGGGYHAFTSWQRVGGRSTTARESALFWEAHKGILKAGSEAFFTISGAALSRARAGRVMDSSAIGFHSHVTLHPDAGGCGAVQVMLSRHLGELAHAYRFGRVCFVGGKPRRLRAGTTSSSPGLHGGCTIIADPI